MNTKSISQAPRSLGWDIPGNPLGDSGFMLPIAVEISIAWNNTIQEVIQNRIDGDDPYTFSIGESPAADYLIPLAFLDDKSSLSLVSASDGILRITAPNRSELELSFTDGTQIFFEPKMTRPENIHLDLGSTATINLGNWRFTIRPLDQVEIFQSRYEVDWNSGTFLAISAALHALFFLVVALVPPTAKGLNLNQFEAADRFSKIVLSVAEAKLATVPETVDTDYHKVSNAGPARHNGISGKAGDPNSRKKRKRFALKGPPENTNMTLGRDSLKEIATSGGVLAHIHSHGGPVSPFGSVNPLGTDPENALGDLTGSQVGRSYGVHGLHMAGTGRGGGGLAQGTIGDNPIRVSGIGRRLGPLRDFAKPKKPARPQVIDTGITHLGSISKDIIRRLVKRRLNQVRFCYEQGLLKRSDLMGRVAIRFTISSNGAVLKSEIASSTLGDPTVEHCIAQVIRRIPFPAPPDRSIVVVTYPFVLSSK